MASLASKTHVYSSETLQISLIYNMNNLGPKPDPWGTSQDTFNWFDFTLLNCTYWYIFCQLSNILFMYILTLLFFLLNSINGFFKSTTPTIYSLLSLAVDIPSMLSLSLPSEGSPFCFIAILALTYKIVSLCLFFYKYLRTEEVLIVVYNL